MQNKIYKVTQTKLGQKYVYIPKKEDFSKDEFVSVRKIKVSEIQEENTAQDGE